MVRHLLFPITQFVVSLVLFTDQLVKLLLCIPDWMGLLSQTWEMAVSFYELVMAITNLFKNGDGTPSRKNDVPPAA